MTANQPMSIPLGARAQRDPFGPGPAWLGAGHAALKRLSLGTAMVAGAVALLLGAAGCSGGNGGEAVASAPPPSTPPPPPPQADVPPFPAAHAPTAYSAETVTMTVAAGIEPLPGNKARIAGITGATGQDPNRIGMSLTYEGPDRYALDYNGFGGPTFLPADMDGSTAEFDSFRKASKDGYVDNLELARKGAGVTLTYLTFGNQTSIYPYDTSITFFAAGSRTPASQMPTSGRASYAGIADGLWVDGGTTRRLHGSPASLTADFATGQVTSVLDLRGHDDAFGTFAAAPTTVLGRFTGTGAIRGSGASGTYAPAAGYSGVFSGSFFGPSVEEYGLAFRLTGGPNQSVSGVAVGKR